MTFIQILVLVIVVCVSAVECIVTLARASVRKAQVGVPSEAAILAFVQETVKRADGVSGSVRIHIGEYGTSITYLPKDEGDDEECSTE